MGSTEPPNDATPLAGWGAPRPPWPHIATPLPRALGKRGRFPSPVAGEGGPVAQRPGRMGSTAPSMTPHRNFPSPLAGEGGPVAQRPDRMGSTEPPMKPHRWPDGEQRAPLTPRRDARRR